MLLPKPSELQNWVHFIILLLVSFHAGTQVSIRPVLLPVFLNWNMSDFSLLYFPVGGSF